MISSDVLYSMIKLGLTYIAGMQAGARLYSDLSAVQDRIEIDLKSSVEKRGGHPLTTTPSLKEARPCRATNWQSGADDARHSAQ